MASKLTPKKLHFARCVAGGSDYSTAYREAFNPKESTTAASINTLASRLMAEVEVRSRVDTLVAARERAVQASGVSDREKVLSKLRHFMECAEGADAMKIRSAELLGKSVGLFKDVVEQKQEVASADIEAKLQAKLELLLASQESKDADTKDLH